jgi:hypothetical protein
MTRLRIGRGLFPTLCFLALLAGWHASAKAQNAPASSTCVLNHPGDCCSATLSSNQDAKVATAVKTVEGIDFIVMMNRGISDCIFDYNGEMHVPMQSYVGGFNGTWLGGDFTLHYMNDAAGSGSCLVDVYYMNIASYVFPDACQGHRAQFNPTANP